MPATLTQQIDKFITAALAEDVGSGDHTSLASIPPAARHKARLLVKDTGVLAGIELAKRIFTHVDPTSNVEVYLNDGAHIKKGDVAFIVTCNSQALLKAERLVLNTMQRMSGIATMSRQYAQEVSDFPIQILDTRKTTPLIRFLEKWAVRIGGCTNYRDGLYDWIMLKDNHIDACGGIASAIDKVHQYLSDHNLNLGITVEVRNLEELNAVLAKGGITRIMLDNFDTPTMRTAVEKVDNRFEVEASGGITRERLREIAQTGVNYISVGALTHSVRSLDLSLKVITE